MRTLRDHGVIKDIHADGTFKIFPVFDREMVGVNFENADRDDSKQATKGKFDADYKQSYFVNVLEACKNNSVTKMKYDGWLDYYQILVPKNSVIRVQTQPISTRIASGVTYWAWDDGISKNTYYKAGDIKCSSTTPSGEKIEQTDYTKADIIANIGMSMKPATGQQSFDVGYFPNESIPDEYKGSNGLANAVVDSDTMMTEAVEGTDKDGKFSFKAPYTGMNWSLTAIAPNGYYTQWVNMTGDTNGDGYVSDAEVKEIRNKSNTMPDEVYGNKFSGKLDQDQVKLYYYFLPKTGGGTGTKTGTVTREAENFYELAHNIKSGEKDEPVVAAYVDIGGFIGMTDGNGDYEIACNDLPSAGNVSTTITAEGSSEYYTISKLQRYTPIVLPALSKFKPVSVDASYETKSGSVTDDFIAVEDDELTITATVSSESALKATDVQFYIYDESDTEKFELEGREGYSVKTETFENEFTASLTFNPKKDMKWGYKIYARFADQNGEWTNAIDLGYYFSTPVNLAEFVFPLVGSSSLEENKPSGYVQDIIDNPLGDMSIGAINGFETEMSTYTPPGINKNDAKEYTWSRTDYKFGWSETFDQWKRSTSKKSDENKLKKYLKDVYDGKADGKEPPNKSKYATKSSFKWSLTPSVGFNLTLSSRKDGNTYFEDLVFYVKVDYNLSCSNTIKLPIGISILVSVGLKGDAVGIYHMYVDYQDSYETEDAAPYTAEDFGMFKKFNNSVRREGYIFIDPSVSVKLGVGYLVVFVTGGATFSFDMDFQFTESATNSYGDMTIDLDWGIQLFSFEIYSKTLFSTTEKIFNTEGTNEHIDFDYEDEASLMSIEDYFSVDENEPLVLDKPASRAYLENRSEWLGDDGNVALMSIDGSEGTVEGTLRNGTTSSPYVCLAELDNGEILMVFIDDDESRSNVNKRALYYSVFDGAVWSEPILADDDGTIDDYPTLCDLGNGKIMVAWSSAEEVMPDNSTVEDVMKSTNIKVSFFDKTSKSMSVPEQITKTTADDYTADVMPGAAYDAATGKVILYYTKTEYDDIKQVSDISGAYSVNAYMFYDTNSGTWSSADDYTTEELAGVGDIDKYKENWYGQRFLDLRLNKTSDDMPRVVDTASIGYNGLGLFAWTVDWDDNLDTVDDRDVFMQIYNFSENSFTHIMRATTATSSYSTPKFGRSNNQTYLFYGEKNTDDDHGSIKYLNVSDLIKNNKFEKISEGQNEYYVFKRESGGYEVKDEQGNVIKTVPSEKVLVEADTATECDNSMDYDVKVGKDGQMYLFWTDMEDNTRQIFATAYNGTDADETVDNEEDENVALEDAFMSEPIRLTNVGDNGFYSGIGAAVVDGKLIVVSAKGNYGDESATSLVWQQHTPFSEIKASEISIDKEYPMPLSTVTLTATVKNEGLSTMVATDENPIIVTFTMNGEVKGTSAVIKSIPGGSTADVLFNSELPEDISNVEFSAYVGDRADESVSVKIKNDSKLEIKNGKINRYAADGYEEEKVVFSGNVENSGNAPAENVEVKAVVGEAEVGSAALEKLEANETQDISITLDIPDSLYKINDDGVGVAEAEVSVALGDDTVACHKENVEKVFNKEATELLDKVTDVKFDSGYAMKPGDEREIQPAISGVDEGELHVEWLGSSDADVAYINYDNIIVAGENGKATITGIVVPNEERIEFDVYGNAEKVDWKTLIPSDKLMEVTAEINVSDGKKPSSGGSGGGSSRITYSITFETNGGNSIEPVVINRNSAVGDLPEPVKDGYTFEGWYTDEALTKPFTAETKVTSNLKLYAKWTQNDNPPQSTNKPSQDEDGYVNPFIDVHEDDWFYNSVKYAYENNLFSGIEENIFAPDTPLTRAMLVTVLYRAEGEPAIDGELEGNPFTDVDVQSWYGDAVYWAQMNGIVKGYSEEEFAPDDNITREQMAAIMYRYAQLKGNAPEGQWAIRLDYNDLEEISDWAVESVMFCTLKEIMLGDENKEFNPLDNTTRAEAAAVFERFLVNSETVSE